MKKFKDLEKSKIVEDLQQPTLQKFLSILFYRDEKTQDHGKDLRRFSVFKN